MNDLILLAILLFFLYQIVQTIKLISKNREEIAKLQKEIAREATLIIPCKVEKHYDCFYFFHDNTDEFILQGRTREEIIAALRARYGQSKRLAVDTDDPTLKDILGIKEDKKQNENSSSI